MHYSYGAVLWIALLVPLSVVGRCGAGSILYVNQEARPGGNGSTWDTALASLDDAISFAAEPASGVTQVWVATGRYVPATLTSPTIPQSATFKLVDGVALYGGFAGGERSLDQRDWIANETILSGDVNNDDWVTIVSGLPITSFILDNVRHVVTAPTGSRAATIDGFTISGGNAKSSASSGGVGGAVKCQSASATFRNCHFKYNRAAWGGAVSLDGDCAATFTNCRFTGNICHYPIYHLGPRGAAVFGYQSSAEFTDCAFESNWLLDSNPYALGGAVCVLDDGTTRFEHCSFTGNNGARGGAIYTSDGHIAIIDDCSFRGNQAVGGGAISVGDVTTSSVVNSIFSDNLAQYAGAISAGSAHRLAVSDCRFERNRAVQGNGGAVSAGAYELHVQRCDFTSNSAQLTDGYADGGAMVIGGYAHLVSHCRFSGNTARVGGAICSFGEATIDHCLFTANAANGHRDWEGLGGAIAGVADPHLIVTSTTIVGNVASDRGGAVFFSNHFDTCSVRDSIAWNNVPDELASTYDNIAAAYSCIQNGFPGPGIVSTDPSMARDFSLQPGSPCIDAGNNYLVNRDTLDLDGDGDTSEYTPIDLGAQPRFVDASEGLGTGCGTGALVDMGAFEFQRGTRSAPVFGDVSADGTVDGVDLGILISAWLSDRGCEPSDLDANGIVNGFDLALLLGAWSS